MAGENELKTNQEAAMAGAYPEDSVTRPFPSESNAESWPTRRAGKRCRISSGVLLYRER
jgi:hypothetical protein